MHISRSMTPLGAIHFTIVIVLVHWAGPGGEVESVGHGLGGHHSEQPVHQWVLGVHGPVQRVSQGLVGPGLAEPISKYP